MFRSRRCRRLLTNELILATIEITAASLGRYFGIERPRLAVSGLNPHAGEDGGLGREEIDIIAPAIAAARPRASTSPVRIPPTRCSTTAARASYDAAICMYHDQALVPFKTLAFEEGVNVTLGLPFVRTSPDHGTAFGLAGTGKASPRSLIEALRLAAAMCDNGRGARVSTPDGLPPLREVIRASGLSAKKSLGQNFLLDFNLTRRIARAAGPLDGVTVVEVGPGPGGLTRALLIEGAARVVAIEKDQRCLPPLGDIAALYPGRLDIVVADAQRSRLCAPSRLPRPLASSPICLIAWPPLCSSPG